MDISDKQRDIMRVVMDCAGAGALVEFWELKSKIEHGPKVTPQAIQSSIRYLEAGGLLVRQYGPRRKLFLAPTLKAYQVLRPETGIPVPSTSFV